MITETRPSVRRLGLEMLVVATAAVGIAAWLFQVWKRTLSVPFENVYDARQVSASVKSIIDHGLFSSNSELGAPFGKDRFDWPVAGEMLQRTVLWVMSGFTGRFGVIVNAYFLLGFGAVAASAFAVMRVLRFSAIVAAVAALLYAFLPYHFFHAENHLLRSTYASAPLSVLLIYAVLGFRGVLLRDPHARMWPFAFWRANIRWPRVMGLAALATVIALTETMTTVFTMVALVACGILVAVRDRSVAVLVPAGAAVAVLGLAFLIALAPNLLYWNEHGRNESAVRRIPAEQEYYGLQVSQLVLPIPNHRLVALRSLQEDARHGSPIPSEGGQQLGVLGTLGILFVLGALLNRGLPRRAHAGLGDRPTLLRFGGLATAVLVAFGTASGLGLILGVAGFTHVRTWNRVVVLIGFFAMVGVAIGLERLVSRARDRRRWLVAPLAVVVLGFGLWDTARPVRIDQATEVPLAEAVNSFVLQIENELPEHAAVFQLPVIPYPEYKAQYARVYDYEVLLPYLWSNDLRFSYGGTKGRPEADWQAKVDSQDPVPSLAGLRGLGFDGIMLDTFVYDDGGTAARKALDRALGKPTIVAGPENRFQFWDLRQYAPEQGLSAEQLRDAARNLVGPLMSQLPADLR